MSDKCKPTIDLILDTLDGVEGADSLRRLFDARKAANEATDLHANVVDGILASLADGFVYGVNAIHRGQVLNSDQRMMLRVLMFNLRDMADDLLLQSVWAQDASATESKGEVINESSE